MLFDESCNKSQDGLFVSDPVVMGFCSTSGRSASSLMEG